MVKDGYSVLFVHIPKCGGSSFEHEMSTRGWKELLSVRGINARDLEFLNCSPQHMHAALIKEIVKPDKVDKIITLVREPLTRLRSEYSWQLTQGLTEVEPKIWLDKIFDLYANDNFIYDNHIRPQSEFILEGSSVFKLEENGIEKALEELPERKDGWLVDLMNSIKINKKKKLKETSKSAEIIKSFDERKDYIYEFYKIDYELFGYAKP